MAEAFSILPKDCWELVLYQLEDDKDALEASSLVCKDFYLISSCIVNHLKVYNSSIEVLAQLFKRFRSLKSIDLTEFYGSLDGAIVAIVESGLNIESLNLSSHSQLPIQSLTKLGSRSIIKTLKTLKCSRNSWLDDQCLIEMSGAFPSLEDLDISHSGKKLTATGIEQLTRVLANLRKINLRGISHLSALFVDSLASNCTFLREVNTRGIKYLTEENIGNLLRKCPDLVSLKMDRIRKTSPTSIGHYTIENSILFATKISELELSHQSISDQTLQVMANAKLPFRKLGLSHCFDFSADGLSHLLNEYQFLEELDLQAAYFLEDKLLKSLIRYLQNLSYINLSVCSHLTSSTFFSLVKSCPLLIKIEMARTDMAWEGRIGTKEDLANKNYHLRSVKVSWNRNLNDNFLKKLGLICPNLEFLDMSWCGGFTKIGIRSLKVCKKIKQLIVTKCRPELFKTNFKFPALELLEVTDIKDEELEMIADSCPKLRILKLERAKEVTEDGILETVRSCKKLREIHLKGCVQVGNNILPLMALSRPSLRRIIPPYQSAHDHEIWKFFRRQSDGSLICNREEDQEEGKKYFPRYKKEIYELAKKHSEDADDTE